MSTARINEGFPPPEQLPQGNEKKESPKVAAKYQIPMPKLKKQACRKLFKDDDDDIIVIIDHPIDEIKPVFGSRK